MRLNQQMRQRLLAIIMANTKFTKHSEETIQKAFMEAEEKLTPKEIKAVLEKYPEFFSKFCVNFHVYHKDILTKEEQEQFTYLHFTFIRVIGKSEVQKEDSSYYYYKTHLNPTNILSWFKDYPELEFVRLTKENIISDLKKITMEKELTSFISTCTTDKQIILTLPEFEKYFNEAGIISATGGSNLPVTTNLINLVKSYLN